MIRALRRLRQVDLCEFKGLPGLQSKFQDSQGYTEKPCLKKPKPKPNKKGVNKGPMRGLSGQRCLLPNLMT